MTVTNASFRISHENHGMGRKRSEKPTKPVRLHVDVAEMAETLAPIFKATVPDFLSDRLRPVLEALGKEAQARLAEKFKAKK